MSDELARALATWSDDARLDTARQQRAAQRWQEQAAAESATLVNLLADISESATTVQIETIQGRIHNGVIRTLGQDFVALKSGLPGSTIVPIVMIAGIHVAVSPRKIAAGERQARDAPTFIELLGALAELRSRVRFISGDAEKVQAGELVAVGQDVMTVAQDSIPASTLFVPIARITELATL